MKLLLRIVAVILIVISTSIVTLDFFGGCGETFVFADGSRHQGECIGRQLFKQTLKGIFK